MQVDRAQGCLLGQLAEDALGGLVEFQSPEQIRRDYPGGVRAGPRECVGEGLLARAASDHGEPQVEFGLPFLRYGAAGWAAGAALRDV